MTLPNPRTRLEGAQRVRTALLEGKPVVRVVLLPRGPLRPPLAALEREALATGATIWRAGEGDLRRMSAVSAKPAEAIAMCGPSPSANLTQALARGGISWLLHRAGYPSNVGFAVRTAEVSGADAVIVDAPNWNRADRSRASHVSMGADRLLPVLFESTQATLEAARAHGHRILALEDAGQAPPFEHDLTGGVLIVVGNERSGVPADVLSACDQVMRIPMPGFIPSYNVQAAIAAVAYERVRQLHQAAIG